MAVAIATTISTTISDDQGGSAIASGTDEARERNLAGFRLGDADGTRTHDLLRERHVQIRFRVVRTTFYVVLSFLVSFRSITDSW